MSLAHRTHSPALAVLACLVGVALQLQQGQLQAESVYAAVLAASLLLLAAAWRRPSLWLALLAALLLGWGSTGWRAAHFQAGALNPALEGRDIEVRGQVQGLPQPGADSLRFRLRVDEAWLDGRPVVLPALLALAWYAPRPGQADPWDDTESARQPADLRSGEVWRMVVRLKAPHGGRNPHGFDQELWLWEQGIQAVGHVRSGPRDAPPQRLQAAGWNVDGLRQSVRSAIEARVSDASLAGVLSALVMGDQATIERADWDVFRATGVAHLMSISGLHITLLAWLASRWLGLGWRLSARWTPALCLAMPAHRAGAWGGLLLASAYAVFAGWGVPAQRTVWMLAVAVLLHQGSRRWPWPQVWLLAMGVVVLLDPWALLQAGFWLSFVAVGVLMAGGRSTAEAAPTLALATPRAMLVRAGAAFLGLMREQGLVTVALAPLTLLLFQQLSLVGLLANLLAIPLVTLLVTPLALVGLVLPGLWPLAALLLEGLMHLLRWLADWPGAVWTWPAAPVWCGAAALLGGLLLVLRWPLHLRLFGLPLVLPLFFWQPARPPVGEMELLALDVGQGAAVLVRTANHSLLYDAGPRYSRESDAGHRVLLPLLRALDVRLDGMVLSHSDTDHVGGAGAVRASQPQAWVSASFDPPGGPPPRWQRCLAGQRWVWDGVVFEFLHPAEDDLPRLRTPNQHSCVLRLHTPQGTAALLTGDLEAAQEDALRSRIDVRADWLLVPHHGSRSSSSAAFLLAVQPRLAVVQAAYRNRFGHPAPEVMARYQALGVTVASTPECGAVTWRSTQPGQWDCQRELARRYWHHPGAARPQP